jgi:Bacterial TniB protein
MTTDLAHLTAASAQLLSE